MYRLDGYWRPASVYRGLHAVVAERVSQLALPASVQNSGCRLRHWRHVGAFVEKHAAISIHGAGNGMKML